MGEPNRRCVFCGSHDASREHILRRKWRDLLNNSPGELSWTNSRTTAFGNLEQSERRYRALPFDAQVKAACRSCNNGWMNNLENEVEDSLLALIRGDQTVVRGRELRSIARWAVKTTLMRQLTVRHGEAQWESPRFQEVYQDDLAGPVSVAIAHVASTRKWPRMPLSAYMQKLGGDDECRIVYCTIIIEHLALHIAMSLESDVPPLMLPFLRMLHRDHGFGAAVQALSPWPKQLRWPLPQSLPDTQYAANLTPHILVSTGVARPESVVFIG